MEEPDIHKCPTCGGVADQGFDRCYPPNPYECTKCEAKWKQPTHAEEPKQMSLYKDFSNYQTDGCK